MSGPGEVDFWTDKYTQGKSRWHAPIVNQWLHGNFRDLTNERKGLRVFVPLCGKSLDMIWLAEEGHNVVGVDVVTQAATEFFENIPHTISPIDGCDGKLYKSNDGKYTFYNCSFFDITSDILGKFDAIWDRGSLVALPPDLSEPYSKIIKTLMKPDCVYFLERFNLPPDEEPKPPFFVSENKVKDLFRECDVQLLHSEDSPAKREQYKVSEFVIQRYRITMKQ